MPWRETPAELARARAEQAIQVPTAAGMLFGIFTPPDPAVPPAQHCVVFFTRPRSHRNRMWVEGARRLATKGFATFRFDYHGAGDSEGVSTFLNPNQPYRDDANAVIAMLRERCAQTRFIVVGACFDARTALSAFADQGPALAGMVFFAAPVMELETLVKAHADQKDWMHLLRALGNPQNWRALASAERWRYMTTVLTRVAGGGSRNGSRNDTPLADSFVDDFRALVQSGARALFVYGELDPEYASFQIALQTVFARLSPAERARLEVEVWPEDVHGFLNLSMQRKGLERTLEWCETFHATPSATGAAPASVARGG